MFTLTMNNRENDTIININSGNKTVVSFNCVSNNIGETEYTVEAALHFSDGVMYVITKWEHVLGSPVTYLKGYVQELLRFLNTFDMTKVSSDSDASDKVIEKLQSLTNNMLNSKKQYYKIVKKSEVGCIKNYDIHKL